MGANVALFDLTKFDIESADPDHPGFNIGVGEVESRGLELNLQGELLPQWNVLVHVESARPIVVAGATGATALQPENIAAGQLLPYVSNRTASVWTSYRVPQGVLRGFSVGGAEWASAANVLEPASIPTSAHHAVSAFAAYDASLLGYETSLQVNVDNVTDERYLLYQADTGVTGGNTLAGTWGAPRQMRVGIRMRY